MTGLKPPNHWRDHWADGPDALASKWQVAGEGSNPDLESPWTGTLRWRHDGNGDLELDGDIADGTFEDTVIFLPGAYWPAVTRTRPGWLTSEGMLIATTVASSDGEVTVSEVTASGGGGGGDAADVTFDPGGTISATNVQDAIDELGSEKVPNGRTITAGSALTGGGDLSANRTLDVAVDGSTIEVSSDALRVKDGGITSAKIADGTITTTDLAFDPATQTELDAHVNDTSDAHDASAISVADAGNNFTATDVESALAELYALGGGGGGGTPADVQVFNAGTSQTWTKPGGTPKLVRILVVGPGGGGGGGPSSVSTIKGGGSAGGGTSPKLIEMRASDLPGTVNVDVGAGGTGGGGGSAGAGANGSNGNDGSGPTSFGSYAIAYAGGGGIGGTTTNQRGGGAASMAQAASSSTNGTPFDSGGGIAGQAGGSTSTGLDGPCAEWGGASGAGSSTSAARQGGSSIYGGPGGGNGGRVNGSNVGAQGGSGGTTGSYSAGGGASPGTSGGSPTDGSNGTFTGPYCGSGGGGGGSGSSVAGKNGGTGSIGAGGGGGGAGSNSSASGNAGGTGGAGGDGRCIVVTYY